MSKQVIVSSKYKSLNGKFPPSHNPSFHTDADCFLVKKMKIQNTDTISEEKAIEQNFKPCWYCSRSTIKETTKEVVTLSGETRELNTFNEFSIPAFSTTNQNLTLPINCTETLTLNGTKYIREDKCCLKPVVKGILIMEDGKEYNLI